MNMMQTISDSIYRFMIMSYDLFFSFHFYILLFFVLLAIKMCIERNESKYRCLGMIPLTFFLSTTVLEKNIYEFAPALIRVLKFSEINHANFNHPTQYTMLVIEVLLCVIIIVDLYIANRKRSWTALEVVLFVAALWLPLNNDVFAEKVAKGIFVLISVMLFVDICKKYINISKRKVY